MNITFSKVLLIILISVILSFVYNHFNPNGLQIIRQEKVFVWETDSLLSAQESDSIETVSGFENESKPNSLSSDDNTTIDSFDKPKAIKLDKAYKLHKNGIKFIDARSPEEFVAGHIKNAINIPFYGSENYLDVVNKFNKNEILVTYCSSADCDMSILSANELFELGFKRIYVFVGGYDEWTRNNLPTNKD
jgi:rhodanese-related sulfurtransferase